MPSEQRSQALDNLFGGIDSMKERFSSIRFWWHRGAWVAAMILAVAACKPAGAEGQSKSDDPAALASSATTPGAPTATAAKTDAAKVKTGTTANPELVQKSKVDFAALTGPGRGLGTEPDKMPSPGASDSSSSTASSANPSTTSAASATVTVPIQNDAAIKELADMKKQFDQVTQIQAAIKSRIGRLESELTTDPKTGDSVSAETDANTLRAAENGGSGTSASYGQAVAAPPAAVAPAALEIDAQVTTQGEPFPGDWTWTNNNGHQTDSPMATKYFTPEFRADANYTIDMNHPEDDTLGGSTETFRSDEWQLQQISVGGDIRINNVRGRFLCLCGGLWAVATTRNDPSVVRGDWDLSGAYKYVAEGWGGYHWNVQHGLNLDAGIFVSYIGLFSYYNFDNWTYQPSFVSSNTPWFFN